MEGNLMIESWQQRKAKFEAINHLTLRAFNRLKLMGYSIKSANDSAKYGESVYIQTCGDAMIGFDGFRYDMEELKRKNPVLSMSIYAPAFVRKSK